MMVVAEEEETEAVVAAAAEGLEEEVVEAGRGLWTKQNSIRIWIPIGVARKKFVSDPAYLKFIKWKNTLTMTSTITGKTRIRQHHHQQQLQEGQIHQQQAK